MYLWVKSYSGCLAVAAIYNMTRPSYRSVVTGLRYDLRDIETVALILSSFASICIVDRFFVSYSPGVSPKVEYGLTMALRINPL